GGLWGKGFTKGTQGQLRFLPVAHNDFIFSVLAEEQGFAGVIVALALYLFVILRALESARLAKDRLGAYLVLGILASFTFQVTYNITMSAGLAPVKGLTLPLMSYGGSSMIATLAGLWCVLNVRLRGSTTEGGRGWRGSPGRQGIQALARLARPACPARQEFVM